MKNLLLLLLFAVVTKTAHAQIINTVAGTGVVGLSGDGGPATLAQISDPLGIAIDATGNVYFSDVSNHNIRKIDAHTGIITTIAGTGIAGYSGDSGPATLARLNSVRCIAFDTAYNLYLSDMGNGRIRKISTSGVITTIAGSGSVGFGGDGGPATMASLNETQGVAVDRLGNVFIADVFNNRVRKIDAISGIITTVAGEGSLAFGGDGGPATNAQLNRPWFVSFDRFSNLYISERGNNRIRKVTPTGTISTIAGTGLFGYSGDGGPATLALFRFPVSTAHDANENIIISDYQNHCLRKIDTSGIITTVVGTGIAGFSGDGGPATMAKLNQQSGIAIDREGKIYICDLINRRIRVVMPFNNQPYFIRGRLQTVDVCGDFTITDTLLAVVDSDAGQTVTWSPLSLPIHGSVVADYFTTSTGGLITPTSLTYTPDIGYIGPDTFKVRVTDGSLSDTTIICVNVHAVPHTSGITGRDSVCVGATIVLSDTATGGTWASTGGVTVAGSAVTGIAPGTATVTYTITNDCGTATATKTITVLPSPDAGSIAGADTLCPGDTATLIATIPGGSWASANTAIASISTGGRVQALATGRDTVRYTITNGYCSATALHYLYVQPLTACNTGIEALQHTTNETMEIAPNPSNGNCTVWLKSPITQQATLIITNAIGIKVKQVIINTNEPITIALDQPAGIYYISVSSASGMYMSKMMVGK